MSENVVQAKVAVDWPTTIAISAMSMSLTVGLHEGIHALACVFGGRLVQLSALHVDCIPASVAHGKFTSGSAAVVNIILGFVLLAFLRQSQDRSSETKFFVWLFMAMNFFLGAGYFMFSGIAGIGDWANVIAGLEPAWLWRVIMAIVGTGLFTYFVYLSLVALGSIIGGTAEEQINRAVKLGVVAYVTAVIVVLLAGVMNPFGMGSLPVVAGMMAVMGGQSPLLWMMQWFKAESFVKSPGSPLAVERDMIWITAGVVVTAVYVFLLGPALNF